jgi:hypothetical protein
MYRAVTGWQMSRSATGASAPLPRPGGGLPAPSTDRASSSSRACSTVTITAALQPYLQAGEVSTLASAVIDKGSAAVVRHVMVGGEWLVFDGSPTRVDLQRANRLYADLAMRLAAREPMADPI